MHIYIDKINQPLEKEIVLYSIDNSPHFDTQEEWLDWVQYQGEVLLQVQCGDGIINIVRKIDWDVRESLQFEQFWRERGIPN